MILHIVEGGDGTRHIHAAGCGHIDFQIEAGEVDELELADDVAEDDVLLWIWEDVLDPDLADDEALDEHEKMTVYRRCVEKVLPWAAADLLPKNLNAVFDEEFESSGNCKADDFMDEAEDAGWAVEFAEDDGLVNVHAKRKNEVLDLTWSRTRLEDAHHLSGLPGEVAKRLSSVKGAIAILHSVPPKPKAQANGRQVVREEPVKRILKHKIPFDLDEAYDDEIISAVQGHWLVWWNNTSEDYEKHFCMKQKNHIKIETGTAGRAVLTFISPEGFRSVALEELVQVK